MKNKDKIEGLKVVDLIVKYGIPEPWETFGILLSQEAALSTGIIREIMTARQYYKRSLSQRGMRRWLSIVSSRRHYKRALKLFSEKRKNVKNAKNLITDVLAKYDANGNWTEIDKFILKMDFDDILKVLQKDFSLHPFPAVLKSLDFNWRFMKDHGCREFYVMTGQYLNKIEQLTERAEEAIRKEIKTRVIEYYPMINMNLASIEVPLHCDVCNVTIAIILLPMEHLT